MDDLLRNENLLIRYIDGELALHEKAALEEKLKEDELLRAQLQQLQLAVQAVKHHGTAQKVASLHAEMMREFRPGPQASRLNPVRKSVRYAMAVAATILVVFAGMGIYTASQLSADKLYKESFVDFTVSTSRGNNALTQIEKHYQQKEYLAIVNTSRSHHLDAKDSLLIGLSYLHTGKPGQAAAFFQWIASFENDFRPDGEFYLAMSYLKAKQYSKALPVLQKINGDPSHLYHSRISSDLIENVAKLNKK